MWPYTIQNDATYKLSWFDWPCFVNEVSSMTGRFLKAYKFFFMFDLFLPQVFHDPHGPVQPREHRGLGPAAGFRQERGRGGP